MDYNNMTPPVNPNPAPSAPYAYRRRRRSLIWPLLLILIGTAILADNFGIHDLFDHAMKFIIPIGMITVGGIYLFERTGNHSR